MGDGGTCHACRSAKCFCVEVDDYGHRWNHFRVAAKWDVGSVVVQRRRSRETWNWVYSIHALWHPQDNCEGDTTQFLLLRSGNSG
jgi:hypothetical protein